MRAARTTRAMDSSGTASRVALVHDFLVDIRGAERVFLEICRMYPTAAVFTSVYDEDGTEGRFAGRQVHTSFLQSLRPTARTFRALLPFYPAAIRSFDLSGYDLVISSSSAWAHRIQCQADAVHVSYCHSPFRYAWSEQAETLARQRNPLVRAYLRRFFRVWRQSDRVLAQRPTRYVANSLTTQDRISRFFGRESDIVHPPVETGRFTAGRTQAHYAVVSELMSHKNINVAVAAFNLLRLPLLIVGDGPEFRRLRHLAGPTISFTGRLSDEGVADVMQSARALIVTSVEEFGIAAVESQAAGRPVIALRGGGCLETVIEGVTGCFWSGGPTELARAVLDFDDGAVDFKACVRNAARFDLASFRAGLLAQVELSTADRAGHVSAGRNGATPGSNSGDPDATKASAA